MKFIAPEVEVLKFNVADVLTTSAGGPNEPATEDKTIELETFVSLIGLPCSGNASDNSLEDCL